MDLSQRIRERAFELWQSRPESGELENWLAAERELTPIAPAAMRASPAPAANAKKAKRPRSRN